MIRTWRSRCSAGLVAGLVVLTGCGSAVVTPQGLEVGPDATAPPTAGPTATPLPVVTPAPTITALPVVAPTLTPLPPDPSATAISESTATPESTAISEPTESPVATTGPTLTPEPTRSPATSTPAAAPPTPTFTPEPTVTLQPTVTPQPTITPPPTRDPVEPTPTPNTAPRVVIEQGYVPFASVNGVDLLLPSTRVERIGYHQAGHTGTQQQTVIPNGVPFSEMEDRGRGTGTRTAADIVVDPAHPIVAPISGTVIAAVGYVLYCDHLDDLVFIEPDGLPGFQLKMFHITGLQVNEGDYVVGGETIIANGPRLLPFQSQVDESTSEPSWPHVHIEVVDPSIPDERPAGPGC